MKKGKELGRVERIEIGILKGKGYSMRSIARSLRRSPNTISYEIKENSVCGIYDPLKAHAKSQVHKKARRFQWRKIEEDPRLKRYIIAGLKKHWNPDEIAGEMKRTKQPFYASKTAMYAWLRTSRGERYCRFLYSKRRRVKKRVPKTKRVMIPNRVGIEGRPLGATNRSRAGHWERDVVVGRKGTPGGLAVGQERKARLVEAIKVRSMRPREHLVADRRMFSGKKTLSVTRDNGMENREHEQFTAPSFFCDPYASWQKGSIENANKMLRRYFPKGTDFSTVSQKEVDRVVRIINEKPRKILGYRSALEYAKELGIIKSESVLIEG